MQGIAIKRREFMRDIAEAAFSLGVPLLFHGLVSNVGESEIKPERSAGTPGSLDMLLKAVDDEYLPRGALLPLFHNKYLYTGRRVLWSGCLIYLFSVNAENKERAVGLSDIINEMTRITVEQDLREYATLVYKMHGINIKDTDKIKPVYSYDNGRRTLADIVYTGSLKDSLLYSNRIEWEKDEGRLIWEKTPLTNNNGGLMVPARELGSSFFLLPKIMREFKEFPLVFNYKGRRITLPMNLSEYYRPPNETLSVEQEGARDFVADFEALTKVTPPIKRLVSELTEGRNSEWDKTTALLGFVRSLPYKKKEMVVNINGVVKRRDLQNNDYRTPLDVLINQGGDCSDKSLLLNTMLRAVGIPSRYIIFLADKKRPHNPYDVGGHAMVGVPREILPSKMRKSFLPMAGYLEGREYVLLGTVSYVQPGQNIRMKKGVYAVFTVFGLTAGRRKLERFRFVLTPDRLKGVSAPYYLEAPFHIRINQPPSPFYSYDMSSRIVY